MNWFVNLLFDSSRSHSFITPVEAPASTKTSAESKATESTGLERPHRLCILTPVDTLNFSHTATPPQWGVAENYANM